MKLWNKGYEIDQWVEKFTVGDDRKYDKKLAPYDVKGNIAHAAMLAKVGLISDAEYELLEEELQKLLLTVSEKDFEIPENFEDIHSYIEYLLTEKLGDLGKRIHTGRSRNDQVLVDLHLFYKEELKEIKALCIALSDLLLQKANEHKDKLIPGYTHLQVAMPSSIGLWLSAYGELLIDDLLMLDAAYKCCDQNPLGSAAGYGSSFPIDRDFTTQLLGFGHLKYSSAASQMGRGKTEKNIAHALSCIGATLAKLSQDVILYMCQNFGFISFPDQLTTGSSIMPHKKNPDVFELVRAKCNKLQALPQEITNICNNLNSGYHRDFQILKEGIFEAFEEIKDCLNASSITLEAMEVKEDVLNTSMYDNLFTVEAVNALVLEGIPFREAYQQIGEALKEGSYVPNKNLKHSHKGSIGNLCTVEIGNKRKELID